MRIFLEVVSAETQTVSITNRKTGEVKETEKLVVHALDVDFPEQLYKLQVWEKFEKVIGECEKGAILEVIFRGVRPANQYEKLDQISASEENIRVAKSAAQALKEMAERLSKQKNGQPKQAAVMA